LNANREEIAARGKAIGAELLRQATRRRKLVDGGRMIVTLNRPDAEWLARNLFAPVYVLGLRRSIGLLGAAARSATARRRGRPRLKRTDIRNAAKGDRAVDERHRRRLTARRRVLVDASRALRRSWKLPIKRP
jgi:hypothetical protein